MVTTGSREAWATILSAAVMGMTGSMAAPEAT
jgi:hypothetical protein